MLSVTTDYALRAVLYLARTGDGRLVPAEEIAEAIGAPRNYLSKTLHALTRLGIVTSARGPHGGFSLAVPAAQLTLARVIDCFDEPPPRPRCMLGAGPCNRLDPCAAHERWSAIVAARRRPLAETTVADLLASGVHALSRSA
jgi:Rrf2 family protein